MRHKEEMKICRGSANGLNVDTLISQNIFEDEETGEVIINLPHPLAEKVAESMGLEPVENKTGENMAKFKPGDEVIISKDSKNVWIRGKKGTIIRFLEEENVPGSLYQWTYEVKLEDGDKSYVPQWEMELGR